MECLHQYTEFGVHLISCFGLLTILANTKAIRFRNDPNSAVNAYRTCFQPSAKVEFLYFKNSRLGIENSARYGFAPYFFTSIVTCPKRHKYVVSERNEDTVMRPITLCP